MSTPQPAADIGINPPLSDRREFAPCVANVTGITYAMVVKGDTSTTNFRDVCLPSGAGDVGVRGVVSDQGDPNNSGQFDQYAEFGCCKAGYVEVLLDAGQSCVKDAPAITGATAGTVKPIASESAPYDIVGVFGQTYDNSAGSSPVLVSLFVNIVRRVA
jgi:hypothetical protein